MAVRDFHTAAPTQSLAMGTFQRKTPPSTRMTSTKIEWPFSRIGRIADAADLAEVLFPGNRNHQHAFLVLWVTLKWARGIVPNLAAVAREHGVTRRTYERVRAKMRRLGVIEPVSRFNAGTGHQDGWGLSTRFERMLQQLARKVSDLRDPAGAAHDKDLLLIKLALARRDIGIDNRRRSYKNDHLMDKEG